MNEIGCFHWNLARAFVGMSTVLAVIGPLCNSLIVLITIKTSTMRSTCNVLIAVCAIGDIFHQFGVLIAQLPFLLNFHLEMDRDICVIMMFLPEMGISIGCVCVLLIGMDRMFAVLFSVRYRAMNRRYYHLGLAVLIFASCVYVSSIIFAHYQARRIVCEILTPFGDGVVLFTAAILLINLMSTIVYFICWLGLRAEADITLMKRIVKSLLIIVIVDASGWFLTPAFIHIIQHSELGTPQKFAWSHFGTNFINIALSMKLFIYYFTSSEYRSAIQAIFFKKPFTVKNVSVVSNTVVVRKRSA